MQPARPFLASRLFWATLAILASAATAHGAPLFSGDGSHAWVMGMGDYAASPDGRPVAIAGVKNVEYTKVLDHWETVPSSVPATYASTASATPSGPGSTLLELHTRVSTPNPGDTVGPRLPYPLIEANAAWTNVAATVSAPDGVALPESIRINFEVAYTCPDSLRVEDWGSQDFRKEQALFIGREVDGSTYNSSYELPGEGGRILDGQTAVTAGPDGLLHMGFHFDLAVSPDGVSQQFSVGLNSEIPGLVEFASVDNLSVMRLALTGITLPDGTGLEEAGYAVSFESGLPELPPPSIPEPATWLAWSLLAAGSTRMVRRRRAA